MLDRNKPKQQQNMMLIAIYLSGQMITFELRFY